MKRMSWLSVPVIALLALAPLPALAGDEGSGGGGGGNASGGDGGAASPNESLGFNTASAFFSLYFQSGGNLAVAAYTAGTPLGITPPGETWEEQSQRRFVESVAKERARRNAERQAREDERERKAAENRSEDDLPGLDY